MFTHFYTIQDIRSLILNSIFFEKNQVIYSKIDI